MCATCLQCDEGSEEAVGLAVALERIAAFSKSVFVLHRASITVTLCLCRVMDLSHWGLAGLLVGLLELGAEGRLTDLVSCPTHVPNPLYVLSSDLGGLFCADSPQAGSAVEHG